MNQVESTTPVLLNQKKLIHDPESPYYDIIHAVYRYLVLHGGRGGGKSWQVADALTELCSMYPLRILCAREYQNSIKDSVHKLLSDTIRRSLLSSYYHITQDSIRSKIGGEFIFKGLHNNTQEVVKSAEGVDICWVEEGQSVAKDSWKYLLPTIRKPGSRFIITLNLDNEDDATNQMFIVKPRPRSIVHHVNYDSNPFFSPELEEERAYDESLIFLADNDEERKQAEANYNHVWLGHTKSISNEIIYSGKYVVQEFDDDLWKEAPRLLFGLDFGFAQDPYAGNRMFIIDNVLYISHEANGTNIDFAGNMSPDGRGELEQLLDAKLPDVRNWPIKADNARPETISFLRNKGFNCVAAEKWQGSVEDGITYVRGFRKVVVHPRCKETIKEFKTYKYKVDRKTGEILPIIIDKNNHHMDGIRYGLDGYITKGGDIGLWERLAGG